MTPFTDAHFAATLLECGPHVTGIHTPISDEYLNRLYNHFFELFPTKVDLGEVYSGEHEWFVFLREYLEWVGEKP